MAHFEAHILNFNGAHLLPACLESLRNVDRGSHTLTVNVVDNGSGDASERVVREGFPEVNFLPLGFNYGFSKGNNLGVLHRQAALAAEGRCADYQVLLNSDTQVDPQWLLGAADALALPQVGIVGSKAIFSDRFALLQIESLDPFCPRDFDSIDDRQLGIFLHTGYAGRNIRTDLGRMKLPDAYPRQALGAWLKPSARVFIPIIDTARPAEYSFYLENHHPAREQVQVVLSSRTFSRQITVVRQQPLRLTVQFAPFEYIEVLQNAGSFVNPDWTAGDRGFLEPDEGQYDAVEDVDAVCGVSMFVRDDLWRELGGFDERYFAYYEDTDLSLRARLRGWRCVYTPHSRLLHVHAGSGVEYSDYFNRNVACSHLIFASKMMNRKQWREKLRTCRMLARYDFETYQRDDKLSNKPHLTAYCRYLKQFPYFAKNRAVNAALKPERRLFGAQAR